MGRKLNALEEIQTSLADSEADQPQGRAHLQQQLIERIADTLGITAAQLSEFPSSSGAVQTTIDAACLSELVLTQQCMDLVKAFIEIQDPQDRLRCLQIVREATGAKSQRSTS